MDISPPNGVVWTIQMYKTYSSKWTTVQWTACVTSIWTVQIDDGPMDRLCYVNLDCPNGQRPMLRQFGPSKWTTVQWNVHVTSIWTVQMDDGAMHYGLEMGQVAQVFFCD